MVSDDFLGFMSNLVNSMKLGRNTSLDKKLKTKNPDIGSEAQAYSISKK